MERRVSVISVEGADVVMLQRGLAAGRLPTLARIIDAGTFVTLGDHFGTVLGSAWATVMTGRTMLEHGRVLNRQLVPGTYRVHDAELGDIKCPPFWKLISDAGLPSTVAGMHNAPCISPFYGTQVIAWGTYDPSATRYVPPWSSPPVVVDQLNARFGKPLLHSDLGGPVGERETRRYIATLEGSVSQQLDALMYLNQETEWRFFSGTFAEVHQGGHFLWHLDDPAHPRHQEIPHDLRGRLLDLYEKIDRAIGSVLERRQPEDDFFLLNAHGMEANPAVGELAADVLEKAGLLTRTKEKGTRDAMGTLRELSRLVLPLTARRALARAIPRTRQRLVTQAFLKEVDWEATKAYALPADEGVSFVRVNMRSREPGGTVPPQKKRSLCEEIARLFESLTVGDSDRAAVDEVTLIDDLVDESLDGPFPDVVINWSGAAVTSVRSRATGEVSVAAPDPQTGRNRALGFLAGVGPGIDERRGDLPTEPEGQLIDVGPTLLHRLGVDHQDLPGKVLDPFV